LDITIDFERIGFLFSDSPDTGDWSFHRIHQDYQGLNDWLKGLFDKCWGDNPPVNLREFKVFLIREHTEMTMGN
jgi:hypothetical protein